MKENTESPIDAVRFKMPPYFEFQSPELIETASEFLKAEVLKTPYKACHFETDYKLNQEDMLLKIRVETRLEEDHILVRISGKKTKRDDWKTMDFGFKVFLDGQHYSFHTTTPETRESLEKEGLTNAASTLFLQVFFACVMAVNMRQFEQTEIVAPEKLQKATAKRGKPPIKNYILVSLRPECRAALSDGTAGQKTPHWRRGHLRHLSSGAIVPVSPCMINWRGDVIDPKEYRVKIPQQVERQQNDRH